MPSADEALYGGCGMVSAAVVIGSFLSATTDATVPGVRVLVGVAAKNLKTLLTMLFNSSKVLDISSEDAKLTHAVTA